MGIWKTVRQHRPSLRRRLIAICTASLSVALCVSILVLLFLTSNVMGNYIKREAEFAMEAISESLSNKLTLAEDILLSIRKDSVLLPALMGGALTPQTQNESPTAQALDNLVDIYSDKNIVDVGLPFIEMVYLFDQENHFNRVSYREYLSQEQKALDEAYDAMYRRFSSGETDVEIVAEGVHLNIIYTVYDEWIEPIGTVIFAIGLDSIQSLMSKTMDYPDSFWILFDKAGGTLVQSGNMALSEAEQQSLTSVYRTSCYEADLQSTRYLLYTKHLTMGITCVMGIPANQLSHLLFQTVRPYFFVFIMLILGIALAVFFSVQKLTKPLPEIAGRLNQVVNQDFSSKLPEYDTEEFATVSTAFNAMTDTIHHLINDVYEKKLVAMDTEIRLLQSQINPHFMYNVLSTIAISAQMDGNPELYKMVSDFASLSQARLNTGNTKVPLSQELQYVRFYVDLQAVRFGDRVQYQLEVDDPALLDCLVPKLTLEMIVENAVTHGIEPKDGSGLVKVHISHMEGGFQAVISDNGVGFPRCDGEVPLPLGEGIQMDGAHNRVALNNVYKLMQHFYGEPYGICITSKTGAGTTVVLYFPKEEAERDDSGHDRR